VSTTHLLVLVRHAELAAPAPASTPACAPFGRDLRPPRLHLARALRRLRHGLVGLAIYASSFFFAAWQSSQHGSSFLEVGVSMVIV